MNHPHVALMLPLGWAEGEDRGSLPHVDHWVALLPDPTDLLRYHIAPGVSITRTPGSSKGRSRYLVYSKNFEVSQKRVLTDSLQGI